MEASILGISIQKERGREEGKQGPLNVVAEGAVIRLSTASKAGAWTWKLTACVEIATHHVR